MKLLRRSILLTFTLVAVLLVLLVFLYSYFFQLLPLQRKYLKGNLSDRAVAVAALSVPPLSRALTERDDVSLLNGIRAIMKVDDVYAAFVLDSAGSVVTHALPAEWGKRYNDPVSMLAIKTGSPLFQESGDGKGWIYSVPVTSSATLCIGFSRQKFEENQRHERRHYVYAVLLVFIAVSLALFALYHRIAQRVARLLSSIESAGMASVTQRISVGGDDEFAVIASRVNDLLARLQGEGRSGEEPLARSATLLRLLKEISALSGKGIMVADSDNRVIYAADEAVKFFSLPVNGVSGKHLLDIFRQPVLLTLLKASGTYPGVWQEGRMDDRAIQVLSVPGKRDATSATIIALR